MNILTLCLSPGLGGLELYALRSTQALSHKHNVISVINSSGKLQTRYLEHPNLTTAQLKYSRSYLPIGNALHLSKIIDAHNIDVMHMHWGNDLALAALAKKLSHRKPALIYTRQMKITRNKNDPYHRLLYNQVNLMLCITKLLAIEAKSFISWQADRIRTLYYGVPEPDHLISANERNTMRQQHSLTTDDFVVGLFGRLEEGKGQHLLIQAIARAKKNGHIINALIVGHEMTPGYTQTLQQLASSLAVAEQIHFSGFVTQPQSLMQVCDCIALTSYEETFGLVLPEAMRAGLAVIGSNAGGVSEIIEHGISGLLFKSRDAQDLCEQLERLSSDFGFRQKLSAAGKTRADSLFNQDSHYEVLEQYLLELTTTSHHDKAL